MKRPSVGKRFLLPLILLAVLAPATAQDGEEYAFSMSAFLPNDGEITNILMMSMFSLFDLGESISFFPVFLPLHGQYFISRHLSLDAGATVLYVYFFNDGSYGLKVTPSLGGTLWSEAFGKFSLTARVHFQVPLLWGDDALQDVAYRVLGAIGANWMTDEAASYYLEVACKLYFIMDPDFRTVPEPALFFGRRFYF